MLAPMAELRKFKDCGNFRTDLRHRFQAVYRIVRSRKRTIALVDSFWPDDIERPTHMFGGWFNEVEYGKAHIPKFIQDWMQGVVDQEPLNHLHTAGSEAAMTLAKILKEYRDTGQAPEGGVVAIRYLQEAARDQFGKRAEIINAGTSGAKRVPGGKVGVITDHGKGKLPPGLRAVK